jgi:hypothetical protein
MPFASFRCRITRVILAGRITYVVLAVKKKGRRETIRGWVNDKQYHGTTRTLAFPWQGKVARSAG